MRRSVIILSLLLLLGSGCTAVSKTAAALTPHASAADITEQNALRAGTDLDSDGDGLDNRGEIEIYHTDPHKADTDGDGYSDRDELLHGYDPNGPGKLKTPPTLPLR